MYSDISDEDEFWILDWEHSGYKQISYDLIILLLDSRIELDFHKRFMKIYNLYLNDYKFKLINDWPYFNFNDKKIKYVYSNFFLLEDLLFFLEEENNKIFYKKPHIFNKRLNEIEMILNNI